MISTPVVKDGGSFEVILDYRRAFSNSEGFRATIPMLRRQSPVEAAEFGVYFVDTTPPEGKLWTGAFTDDDGVPVPVFEDLPPPTSDAIDAERDRRISAGFDFGGKFYQSRAEDRENIAGASVAALAAMGAGALPGNYRWHGGDSDFVWIAADNSLTPMDAQTVFAFGQAAMAHKQAHIFAARALKDAEPIPADYADDGYWPGGAA